MARTETITIYLLKDRVRAASDALRSEPGELSIHAVSAGETKGTLFVSEREPTEPDWVRMLGPVSDPPVAVRTASSSGLLVLAAAGRWFAVTFGQGRFLLDQSVYERRFGLRVALNTVDPARLRSAQARTFSDYALHTQRQVSRLSGLEALELDLERDLVTALAGTPHDEMFGKRVDGRDAVRLTAEIEPDQLAGRCTQLLRVSRQTGYRDAFPWIDTIEEITDPEEVAQYEHDAAAALGRREFSKFDLFPPELVDDEIVEFATWPSRGGLVVIEPTTRLLEAPLRAPMGPDAAKRAVHRQSLIGKDAAGQEVARWSLWDCLHYEAQGGRDTVVLDGGQWYRVKRDYAAEIDRFASSLPASGLNLPRARRGESEGDYNARAAGQAGIALLDRDTIRLPGRTAIEACDMFGADRELVHVKRRKGGSAPLSHLFAQSWVSSECLVREPEFRRELRTKLEAAHAGWGAMIDEPLDARRFTIVLALLTSAPSGPAGVASGLPFFSKVNLRQTVRQLQSLGFAVCVDEIPTEVLVPPRAARPALAAGAPAPARPRGAQRRAGG